MSLWRQGYVIQSKTTEYGHHHLMWMLILVLTDALLIQSSLMYLGMQWEATQYLGPSTHVGDVDGFQYS